MARQVLVSSAGAVVRGAGLGSAIFKRVGGTPAFGAISLTATASDAVTAQVAWEGNAGRIYYLVTDTPAGKTKANATQFITIGGPGVYQIAVGSLSSSTEYSFLCYYDSETGTLVPSGATDLQAAGNTATTPSGETAPTAITPTSFAVTDALETGGAIGSVAANQPGCSFSEVTDAGNLFAISSAGAITSTASLTAGAKSYTVRATNGAGSTDQAITITVTATTGSEDLTADATVSNLTDLATQLNAWATSMDGPKVVALSSGTYSGTFNLSNKTFAHQVTIRGSGTYTDSGAPVKCTSIWTFTNCSNIRFYGIQWEGYRRLDFDLCSDIYVDRCWFKGVDIADPTATTYTTNEGVHLGDDDNDRIVFRHCYFEQYKNAAILFGRGDGNGLENCVFDKMSHDCIKVWSSPTNFRMLRCWGARRYNILNTVTHPDYFQTQGGTITDSYCYGNVVLRGEWFRVPGGVNQGIFYSTRTQNVGAIVEQNIMITNAGNGIYGYDADKGGTGTNLTARDNLCFPIAISDGSELRGNSPPTISFFGTIERNIVGILSSKIGSQTGGAGTDGIVLDCGERFSPDTTDWLTYYTAQADEAASISCVIPKAGTRAHWDFVGTKAGPTVRLKEIFVDGIVPGNVGWPVAAPWEDQYNADNGITTTHSGTYDANGNNA